MNQMMIKVGKSFNIKMGSQIKKILIPNFVILLKEELHRDTTNRNGFKKIIFRSDYKGNGL